MTNRFSKSEQHIIQDVIRQIPSYYYNDHDLFVTFIESYFRFLENDVVNKGRNLQATGDIDEADEEFLIRFNNKYTFGSGRTISVLPSVITGDLRFIIKHIKDIYRSKGTERGIGLFFRVAFNEDPSILIPGKQLFSPSDSVYRQSKIIEIRQQDGSSRSDLVNLIGNRVYGSKSGASALVDDFFTKSVKGKEYLYFSLSDINGTFITQDRISAADVDRATEALSPMVKGPVSRMTINFGSSGIPKGTVFTDISDSTGEGLKVSASKLSVLVGTFDFTELSGQGYSTAAAIVVTKPPNAPNDVIRGKFQVQIKDVYSTDDYNSDIISKYDQQIIEDTLFNGTDLDVTNPSGVWQSGSISDVLEYSTKTVGYIDRVEVIESPQNYSESPTIVVRELVFTPALSGTVTVANTLVTGVSTTFDIDTIPASSNNIGLVSISTNSNTVTGTSTVFESDYSPSDIIGVFDTSGYSRYFTVSQIISNTEIRIIESPTFTTSSEHFNTFRNFIEFTHSNGDTHIRAVNNVVNSTALYLDDYINARDIADSNTSISGSYTYKMGYVQSTLNYDDIRDVHLKYVFSGDTPTNLVAGKGASYTINFRTANDSVDGVSLLSSGFGYAPNEQVTLTSENLAPEVNIVGGGGTGAQAQAFIQDGQVFAIEMISGGAGYTSTPKVTLVSGTGVGATAVATLAGGSITKIEITNGGTGYFENREIIVTVKKEQQAFLEGHILEEHSETNSKIFIQDSDFWQEHSYEIQSSLNPDKYRDTVEGLIHMAGKKLFTKSRILDTSNRNARNSNTIITVS